MKKEDQMESLKEHEIESDGITDNTNTISTIDLSNSITNDPTNSGIKIFTNY